MGIYEDDLNTALTGVFNSITKIEERSLRLFGRPDLSMSEVHLIEAAGKNRPEGSSITEIAAELDITLSSVTISINKLAKKGYVLKTRSQNDGRMVFVRLTPLGRKIDNAHRYFHRQMARSASAGFTDAERRSLLAGTEKLGKFLKETLKKLED